MNCCRLYTESDVNLEDLNLIAMGLINDAKCMMDSLIGWGRDITLHGKQTITSSIYSASHSLLLALCELKDWLNKILSTKAPTNT